MDNNNPAEMSNEDLEKDMQQKNLEKPQGNQEKVNKSSAAEGTLKTPEEDESSHINLGSGDASSRQSTAPEADSQDGSMPDPETVGNWESNDDDPNKISS